MNKLFSNNIFEQNISIMENIRCNIHEYNNYRWFGICRYKIDKAFTGDSGHTVKIADKNESKKYPELRVYTDVREPDSLLKELQGSDVVINLAAEHRDDVTPKSLFDDVNVTGAGNV